MVLAAVCRHRQPCCVLLLSRRLSSGINSQPLTSVLLHHHSLCLVSNIPQRLSPQSDCTQMLFL